MRLHERGAECLSDAAQLSYSAEIGGAVEKITA
jgi:hypothetical protein